MQTYKSVLLFQPSSSRFYRHIERIGIGDINDIRNGLLLCKSLEWAFDNSKLSIVPDVTFSPMTLQVRVARHSCSR